MVDFNFSGRPDGIGNRIEQIIMLEGICLKKNIQGNYVWNNTYAYRSYDILFSGSRVAVSEKAIDTIPFKWDENPEEQAFFSEFLDQNDVLEAAKTIKPNFDIYFDSPEKPIGIHIRGTDRIGSDHHHFMKDLNEFNFYISKTIALINDLNPKYIYICSDNDNYRQIFIKNLNKSISIIDPICSDDIPNEYKDFFALSLCDSIYMCSKFSSFSITASLIGNIPIVAYTIDNLVAKRYQALFKYELDKSSVKVKNYYVDPSTTFSGRFKKQKQAIKGYLYRKYKNINKSFRS